MEVRNLVKNRGKVDFVYFVYFDPFSDHVTMTPFEASWPDAADKRVDSEPGAHCDNYGGCFSDNIPTAQTGQLFYRQYW